MEPVRCSDNNKRIHRMALSGRTSSVKKCQICNADLNPLCRPIMGAVMAQWFRFSGFVQCPFCHNRGLSSQNNALLQYTFFWQFMLQFITEKNSLNQ